MEASVSSLFEEGERVTVVSAGKFGERWAEIAKRHNLECEILEKPYGESVSLSELSDFLEGRPPVQALFLQGCETSTGTSFNLEEIAKIKDRHPALLLIVDAITALASQTVETDAWDLDVVIGGGQKSFGIPPGVSFLALSQRAIQRIAARGSGRSYYLDLARELKRQETGSTAFTAPVSLVVGLEEACREILHQGLDQVIQEAELMARCTRAALLELGFRLLSSSPANALTAAFPPEGFAAARLRADLEERFGLKVAGGQGNLKNKIIRIAHLGYFDVLDVYAVIGAIESILAETDSEGTAGRGLRTVLREFRGQVTA